VNENCLLVGRVKAVMKEITDALGSGRYVRLPSVYRSFKDNQRIPAKRLDRLRSHAPTPYNLLKEDKSSTVKVTTEHWMAKASSNLRKKGPLYQLTQIHEWGLCVGKRAADYRTRLYLKARRSPNARSEALADAKNQDVTGATAYVNH